MIYEIVGWYLSISLTMQVHEKDTKTFVHAHHAYYIKAFQFMHSYGTCTLYMNVCVHFGGCVQISLHS